MTLFGSLRRTTQDQKDHSSDDDDDNDVQLTPLLADPTTHPSNNTNSTVDSLSDSFTLRIKLNNGKSTIDYTLNNISQNITVSTLKESILKKHFAASSESNNSNNRYLRLIVRGRMMAPDTSHLDNFSISNNDVIHAVLAKEGARGGQQALMLRRINNNTNSVNRNNIGSGGRSGGANTSNASARQSPWRRIGIDQNGVVIPRPNDNDEESDDDDTSEDDFEDANGEIDLEGQLEPPQRRRRRRERRGFDRLRAVSFDESIEMCTHVIWRKYFDLEGDPLFAMFAKPCNMPSHTTPTCPLTPPQHALSLHSHILTPTPFFFTQQQTGMTRAEVTAIRLYFARSVDRYIERRRVMIRASQRLRNSLNEIDNTTNNSTTSSPSRARSNTGGSANSLLDVDLEDPNVNNAVAEGSESNANADNSNNNGSTAANNNAETTSATSTNIEGEEILNDRLRMEDEWMSTQVREREGLFCIHCNSCIGGYQAHLLPTHFTTTTNRRDHTLSSV